MPGNDRHNFSLPESIADATQAEIFVYGKLITKGTGTATDSVRFQKKSDPSWSGDYAWGGIRVMPGGSVDLNHTSIRDMAPPPVPPTGLTAQVGNKGVTLAWVLPEVADPTITGWTYRAGTISGADTTWADWQNVGVVATTSHLVEGLINGTKYTFQVAAVNSAGRGPASEPSAAVTAAGPPEPPELTVAAGHERVRVRWSPGADNGSKIEQHEWRYRASAAAWNPNWTVYATEEQIVRNLDNDTTYTFQMKAKNKVGYSKVVAVQATPRHPITGPTAISVAENRDGSIASYRFAPAALDQSLVDYRLKLSDIADSGLFELDRQGGLHFRDAPDFEAPTDGDGDGVYTVWLKAAPVSDDGAPVRRAKPLLPFTKQVDVTVTDADEPGVIKLSSRSPEVGVPLTAVLTDPDGDITDVRWQWQGQAPDATEWQSLSSTSSAGTQSRYTPQGAQVGWALQAVVTAYRDELGAGKRAESMATGPVQARVPNAPVLSTWARALDGKVALTTRLGAENGAPITRTETRVYRVSEGDTTWVTAKGSWQHDAIDPSAAYYRSLFTGGRTTTWHPLTNGVAHTFEVRSVNAVGPSAIASLAATPGQAPLSGVALLPLTASIGDGQVVLGWPAAPHWARVQYQVQSRVARSGHGWPGWSVVPGGRAAQDTTITGLLNGTQYEFRGRQVDDMGAPVAVSNVVLATPAGRPGMPVLTASGGNGQVRLHWPAAAANGSAVVRYEVQSRVASSGHGWPGWSVVPGGGTARDTTITGLLNGTQYEVEVRAVNGVGAGASASATATPQTTGVRLPLTASGGDGQVTLRWTAPSNRASVHEYQVRQRISDAGQDGSAWSAVPGGSTAHDTTITGLTNGVSYQFEVQAVDSQGTSVAMSNVESATPAGPPGVPALTASGGKGQVVLGWTAAAANGSPIVRYEMQGRVAAAGHGWPGWSAVPGGSTARDTTITGLTNGTQYEFAVRAVNGVGAGASSSQKATPQAAATIAVSFGSASYQATEGGEAVKVSVGLSPSPTQTVRIPVGVSADAGTEAGDYTVAGLSGGTVWLSFASGVSSQSFALTANEDADIDDETVSLSFGTLPAGVVVGTTRQATVTLRDADADTKPVFSLSGTARDALVGHYFSFTRPAATGGNGALTYSVSGSCAGLTVTASSVSGAPSKAGQCGITWTVRDTDGDSDTYSLQISVAADTAPSFASSGASRSALVGSYFSFTRPSASGGNGSLRYSVSGTCAGLTVTTSSVSGSPSASGSCVIKWTVRDTDGDSDTYSLQIAVAADTVPSFASSGASRSALVGQYFSFTRPSASGGNGSLRYSVNGSCAGLTVTTSSVSGSPSKAGSCRIKWTVRDSDGDTDTYALQIAVAADTAPSFASSGTSRSAIVGQYFSFTRPAASGGNGSLRYSVSGTCAGLTVTTSSVSGSPSKAGQCGITWTVRDSDGDTDTYSLQIAVAADTAPAFASSGTSRSAIVGQYFSFTRPAAKGGNGSLRYSVSGTCAGLTVKTSSVSGSPSKAGQCGITWTVRDTDGDTDTYSLQIAVAADTAPSFASSGTSRSALVGQYFSFTRPAAKGGNGSRRYSVSGSCPGLTVTSSSVSGRPSSSGSCKVTWTVRDTDGDTDTYVLRIAVAADTAPSFAATGTTRSATVGQYFSFTRPAASGGNGSLRYSVSGTCAGLTVTSSSVSGAPSKAGQCGITWTVRDTDGDTDTYSLQLSVRHRRT